MRQQIQMTTAHLYCHHTVSDEPNEDYGLHCHPYYEVFYFLRGEVSYRVEGVEYPLAPGSLLLLRPGVFHGVRILTDAPYERVAIHFLENLLAEESAQVLLSPFRAHGLCLNGEDDHIEQYLDAILHCADMPDPLRTIALKPRVESMMAQLCMIAQSVKGDAPPRLVKEPVRSMIDYVSERLGEPLSLDELSARFFLSKNQINRVFRRATGTTVGSYISHKRIALAQQLMLSGLSASEAALRAGFGDYSNFYRTYRRLNGHSPAELTALDVGACEGI